LNAKNSGRLYDLASAGTDGTELFVRARLRATSLARPALFAPSEGDVFDDAVGRLFKRQFDIAANVRTGSGSPPAPPTPKKIAKQAAGEHVSKSVENIVDTLEATSAAQASLAVLIVTSPLFGILQDFIRFRRFFEFGGGFGVVWVAVRMILDRQLAIGAGDFFVRRFPSDYKNRIKVSTCHYILSQTNQAKNRPPHE
jgi:hypothetical protein